MRYPNPQPGRPMRSSVADERGVALLVVIISAILLALLGLSLIWSTMSEVSVSTEMEAHQKALLTAESGFRKERPRIRAQGLSTLLAAATQVNQYLNYTPPSDPTARAYWDRNPIPPIEAINVDWANPPDPIGTRTVYGLLTPPTGTVLGSGRYFAKVTDNDDGDSDPLADADGNVIVRVMGIEQGSAFSSSLDPFTAYAQATSQNSLATVEATMQQDYSLQFGSPFTVYGPTANFSFNGNSFNIDGRPHDLDGNLIAGAPQAGLSLVNNNPAGGDAGAAATAAHDALASNQYDNVEGAEGDFGSSGPSVKDTTEEVRSGSNSDAANLFDPNWLMSFVGKLKGLADNNLPAGSYNGTTWGTTGAPEITFIDGDADLGGNGSGAGLLVVSGSLTYSGAFDYKGLVLVLGGTVTMSGANRNLVGGLFVANMVPDALGCTPPAGDDDLGDDDTGDDDDDLGDEGSMLPQVGDDDDDGGTENTCTYDYGTPSITINGNSNFLASPEALNMALNILPLRIVNWREITSELEPF